jgi:UDP-N-acetyl-D-mannosaminuronic acid dehydrogenase
MNNYFDVVVIGAGRVGLPFSLILEKSGLKVALKEINLQIIKSFKKKTSPFKEKGLQSLLYKTRIKIFKNYYPNSEYYILTVGTPLRQHIETDLDQVTKVIDELIYFKRLKNKKIILRSTIAPGTTNYISRYINSKTGFIEGKDFFLTYCPERIIEGDALKELYNLPQIIGANNENSWIYSKKLFSFFLKKSKILKGSWLDSELAKLFSNIFRYINFAIPNYFMMIANYYKVDPFILFDIMNYQYPRNKGLKSTGLTAGTCLRKDFGMINEKIPYTDLILQAHKINEFMPFFIVDLIDSANIQKKVVGLLGYTFKKDSDDTRDSLSPKIYRYLKKIVPKKILISDYNLNFGKIIDKYNNLRFTNIKHQELINKSDIIIIAVNHSKYANLFLKKNLSNKLIIDPWRVLGKQLFVRNNE